MSVNYQTMVKRKFKQTKNKIYTYNLLEKKKRKSIPTALQITLEMLESEDRW